MPEFEARLPSVKSSVTLRSSLEEKKRPETDFGIFGCCILSVVVQ